MLVIGLGAMVTGSERAYPPAQPLFQAGVCPARRAPPPGLSPHQTLAQAIVQIPATTAAAHVIASQCDGEWQPAKLGAPTTLQALNAAAWRDLNTLTPHLAGHQPRRISLAGYAPNWRYQWPRDAAMVATAFARSGDIAAATAIFRSLKSVQHLDGSFAPRVSAAGRPPDARALQFEAIGWYVWGFGQLLSATGDQDDQRGERAALWQEFSTSIHRSGQALLGATAAGLPPASSDYWERNETALTLATAALTLAGLESIGALSQQLPDPSAADLELAHLGAARAGRLKDAIGKHFGPDFGRYGTNTPPDAAIAFLLPPFQPAPFPGARAAWAQSLAAQYVPASGGYAPGAGWKDDGISWTPETTLHALVAAKWAASGEPGAHQAAKTARTILTWVAAHTTATGAIPEKVAPGGQPAAVAPLAWSAANVVVAISLLSEN